MAADREPLLKNEPPPVASDFIDLLAEHAWRHLLVHDYHHAGLFYALLRQLQPEVASWVLGEALAEIQCGKPQAAASLLAALDVKQCSKPQAEARERLWLLCDGAG